LVSKDALKNCQLAHLPLFYFMDLHIVWSQKITNELAVV